jgi:hypothetical protein
MRRAAQRPHCGLAGSDRFLAESILGFELIKARPVQYILPDGHLDNEGWATRNLQRSR